MSKKTNCNDHIIAMVVDQDYAKQIKKQCKVQYELNYTYNYSDYSHTETSKL